ncbi:phosphonopyruvate decarboxylase [Flaviaesturariibacter flavus]|uniref:Phosphonopyruvate decarboxylase n=1 Tax=Flaviaesturariibacter flavus TaxID=2502780 RepID=A0A4R1B623_9BACT|nr:phosphonopyruvate decarboxylase [Flaviaesturariibacter flavus]TCJ12017.1 phosphonopyruvate decarboxylase [Flaviaesturariibacter flavus]
MIAASVFIQSLRASGVGFFAGVPDSLLSSFSAALAAAPPEQHLVAVNEGAALGLAAGYHFATGGLPLVYLQNSGLGNLVNPLTSLADPTVYSIPMLLLVGWRGEPGRPDEPQHTRMGAATGPLLEALEVPLHYLHPTDGNWQETIRQAAAQALGESRPVAIVVARGVFEELALPQQEDYPLSAASAIDILCTGLSKGTRVVCSTGKIGRIFNEWNNGQEQPLDALLNVGAMGHAGSIATAIALHSNGPVLVLDGDGALLMHLGALALSGSLGLDNLFYVVLNNGAHESVGRQPTLGFRTDFVCIAKACGFRFASRLTTAADLHGWNRHGDARGAFVEIRINTHTPAKLSRPSEEPRLAGARFRKSFEQ